MKSLEITLVWISATIAVGAVALWLRGVFRSASLRTGQQRHRNISVFDLQLSVGGGADRPKREAALYLTLKNTPAEPHSAARLLFEEKVRRLGE
jgi:hypothetical protein